MLLGKNYHICHQLCCPFQDVVHVDVDDDTESARLADIEMFDKW
jgi:hypothetical protein